MEQKDRDINATTNPEMDILDLSATALLKTTSVQNGNPEMLNFWDTEDPNCVINMLPNKMRDYTLALPLKLVSMSAEDFIKRYHDPSDVDIQLRQAFWEEYFCAVDRNDRMRIDRVYGGIISRAAFYFILANNQNRFVYMLKPPGDYMFRVKGLLDLGLNRFHDILKLPVYKEEKLPDGRVVKIADDKLIGRITKIVEMLDNRVRGAVTQKIQFEGKQLNVNVNQAAKTPTQDITQELLNVENEILKLKGPPINKADILVDMQTVSSEEIKSDE